jgi:hypothetical protein
VGAATNAAMFALKLVAGACFEATKTEVVCFSGDAVRQGDTLDVHAMPHACAKGHPLTPENMHTDDREGRLEMPAVWPRASNHISGSAEEGGLGFADLQSGGTYRVDVAHAQIRFRHALDPQIFAKATGNEQVAMLRILVTPGGVV